MEHDSLLTDKLHSSDHQKLKGYAKKLCDSKICVKTLCKSLQEGNACVVRAMESIVKTSKAVAQLKDTAFVDLPSVMNMMSRITREGSCATYQGIELVGYEHAVDYILGFS